MFLLFLFCLFIYLFSKESKKEKAWSWVGEEMGKIMEELWGRKNYDQNVSYKFFN